MGQVVTPTDAVRAQIDPVWDKISDMERPLREAADLALASYMLATTLDEGTAAPLMTIAAAAQDLCKEVEELRGECFHILHGIKFGRKAVVHSDLTE